LRFVCDGVAQAVRVEFAYGCFKDESSLKIAQVSPWIVSGVLTCGRFW
jgi:hypothetical protein